MEVLLNDYTHTFLDLPRDFGAHLELSAFIQMNGFVDRWCFFAETQAGIIVTDKGNY